MNILRVLKRRLIRPTTSTWLTISGVVTLALIMAAWQVGAGVAPLALGASETLSDFRNASLAGVLSDDAESLADLREQVLKIQQSLEPPGRLIRWVGRFSPAFRWMPLVGQEVEAWAGQFERARTDVDTASNLLNSSEDLLDLFHASQTVFISPNSGAAILPLKLQARELETKFGQNLATLSANSKANNRFGLGLQSLRSRSLLQALEDIELQMIEVSEIGQKASGLMVELLEVADGAQPLIGQFSGGNSSGRISTRVEIDTALDTIRTHSTAAKQRGSELSGLISASRYGATFEADIAALDIALDAFVSIAEAGAIGFEVVEPAIRNLEASEGGLLGANGGLLSLMDAFDKRQSDVAGAIAELSNAEQLLDGIDAAQSRTLTSRSLSEIRDISAQLRSGLTLLNSLAPLGKELLGSDGIRRYLILGQSADELRGTGGFVSAVWEVTFIDGSLADIKYQDAVRVDDFDRLNLYPVAPSGLEVHMNGWVWLLRDVSWDPDFPTTARSAEDIYRLGQRQEVDGVVAINQWTLLRVLEAIGEIPSPEGDLSINSRNLLSVLEQGTDEHGRAYVDLVLQGVLDSLNASPSLPTLIKLASSLQDTLQNRDTLLYFDNEGLQTVINSFNWDGSVEQTTSDYLYVVDSNVGWSKADRNIQRDVSYDVDLSRQAQPRATLTLDYTNHSGPGSPGCIPQWLNRGSNYNQLKNACYWNFLRVYIPQEARLLSNTSLPLAEHTVAVEIGKGIAGLDTAEISSSHGKTVFSGLASLEAGDSRSINLIYNLPQSVLTRSGGRLSYELALQKQPGVQGKKVSVNIIPPEGYKHGGSSIRPNAVSESRIGFVIELTRDMTLTVDFIKQYE